MLGDDAGDELEAGQQRSGGLWIGRVRDVVRDRHAQRHHRHAGIVETGVQGPHESGGALVAGSSQPEPIGDGFVGCTADHAEGARVRCEADHRTERDDHLGSGGLCQLQERIGEGAPSQVRLDPPDQHEVVGAAIDDRGVRGGDGPLDDTTTVVGEAHDRPGLGEVEEHLWVDVGEGLGVVVTYQMVDSGGGCAGGIEEALERHDDEGSSQIDGALPTKLGHGHSFAHRPR